MLNLLYSVFIAPLETGMHLVFVNSYAWLHSYGLAILILSLVVNTVLLPLYHVADKWQNDERQKQAKMADKIAEIKQAFKGQERFMMLKTLYRQHHYHPIMAARSSIGFLIQVPFFFAAYQLLSHFPALNGQSFLFFSDLGKQDGLLQLGDISINVLPFAMTAINLLSAFVYTKGLSNKDKVQLYVFAGLFLVLLYKSPAGLVLYWTLNNIFSLLKNVVYFHIEQLPHDGRFKQGVSAWKEFKLLAHIPVPGFIKRLTLNPGIHSQGIFLTALFSILITILIYAPISVYASDPTFFEVKLFDVFLDGLQKTILLAALIVGLYYSRTEKTKQKITFLFCYFAFVFVFYAFVPLFNYGSIDSYFLTNDSILRMHRKSLLYDLSIYFTVYVILRYTIKRGYIKNVAAMLNITLLSLLSLTFLNAYNNEDGNSINVKKQSSQNLVPSYNDALLSFSKDKNNVLVIMLDMFTGEHMSKIIEDDTDINDTLSGFTWYSDVISGDSTFMGEPRIHGGYQYTPESINQRSSKIESIRDEIAKGYQVFANNFGDKNFDVSLAGVQYASCDAIRKYTRGNVKVCNDLSFQKDYSKLYAERNNLDLSTVRVNQKNFLSAFGWFNVVPYRLKKDVYDHGSWMGAVEHNLTERTVQSIAAISSFATLSNINSPQATFKYIQVSTPHSPWVLDGKTCQVTSQDVYPETKNTTSTKVDGMSPEHYYSERCSIQFLSNWFDWMKKNGIYDNTMIVLVSDHGDYDNGKLAQAFGVDVKGHRSKTKNVDYPGRPSGLLLVKDVNANNNFTVSDKFMSTADTPAIVCSVVGGCEGIERDPRIQNIDRSFLYSIGSWKPRKHNKNEYIIDQQYEVKNSLYNRDNWVKIK